uniref:Neural proliferation, differentiation and control 1 n=1 Tax=Strix occidentalis caurina TaxID=311401 RepID=A0A8D0FU20_STROC
MDTEGAATCDDLSELCGGVGQGLVWRWFFLTATTRGSVCVGRISVASLLSHCLRGAGRAASCPRSLDCALQRRQFCPPGSGACGPCLPTFQEDDRGRCIQKQLSPSGRCTHPAAAPSATSHLQTCPAPQQLQELPTSQGGFTSWPGKRGLVALCHRAHPLSLCVPSASAGLIVVCTVAGISALIVAAVCWCRARPPHLSLLSPQPGDKTLAQSAQMYHYQHQKQQMLSMEKHKEEPKVPDSASSDEENEDGDFTVYECPGLAPTGEMELAMDSMPNTGGAPAAGRRGADPALPDCSTPAQ